MNPVAAVLLGLVQGVTEFLPVSSSGHLVLFQHLLGFQEPMVFFDVMLHLGTLAAVCFFYRRELLGLLGIKVPGALSTPNTLLLLGLGTVPTVAIALVGRPFFKAAFGGLTAPGIALLVTGCLLWTTRRAPPSRRDDMRVRDALIIGTAQGFAIMPGISRSGTTIAVALWLGLQRELAARYSFLLAIPAIMGAVVLEWESPASMDHATLVATVLGTLTAAGSGYLALSWLVRVVHRGAFWVFAPYCWCVGILVLLLARVGPPAGPTIEANVPAAQPAAAIVLQASNAEF